MELLQEITLTREGNPDLHITLCPLTQGKDKAVMALQDKVFSQLRNKDWFAMTNEEQVAESLEKDFCLGVYDREKQGKLIAFGLLIVNRKTSRHVIHKLKQSPFMEEETMTIDSIFVDEDYRGYGLQSILFDIFIRWGEKQKNPKIMGAYTTISPDNRYSLHNAAKNGFAVLETKPLYGGKMRAILEKKMG